MNASRRFTVVEHLSNAELDDAIDAAQKADETRLVRRLCFVKNLYEGKTQQQAGAAVGVSQPTSSRWARAWNQNGIEGLRPRFGGGRPPKLTPTQWDEICALLKDGQPWTPREIHALIEDRYGVTYHPMTLHTPIPSVNTSRDDLPPVFAGSPAVEHRLVATVTDGHSVDRHPVRREVIRLALGLDDIKHEGEFEPDQTLRPLFRWCFIGLTVALLVIARRVLAFWALRHDDRSPDPDGRLTLLDVPIELFLPRSVACHAGCLGTLAFDQERVSVRVAVKATLDIKPLLELLAGLRIADAGDEVVDPVFDRTVHLVGSCAGLGDGDRRVTDRGHGSHQIEFTVNPSVQNALHPSGAYKNRGVSIT